MKWIGQHIFDSIAKFRNTVDFLETVDFSKAVNFSEDVAFYQPTNDGNPTISLGSSATNRLEIKSTYNSGTQLLCDVDFTTYTTSSTSNDGRFNWYVDEVLLSTMNDSGLFIYGSGVVSASGDNATITATDTRASSTTQGGKLRLRSNDGAVMGDNHRLGVIEFYGAEDTSSTYSIGARIQAICRDAWDGSNNDADLEFYTTNGTTEALTLTLNADGGARFGGPVQASGFTGDVTGNVSGSSGSCTGQAATVATIAGLAPNTATAQATQPNIESIGTDGDTLTILSDQLHMSNTTASMPTVKLTNTADDDASSELVFEKLRDDNGVATGQNLGAIWFRGQDLGGNTEDYAYIIGEIDVSLHGQESGQLKLGVANHDGGNGNGLILTGGSENDEVDVTLGLGANSVVTIPGNINVAGNVTTGAWRGKQIQVISANFKDNQGTTETFLPLSAQPEEKTGFANEQTLLLMPTGGNVKEIIVRANYNTYTSENIVLKVYTRAANKKINNKTQIGSDITIAAPTQNTTDSNNTRSTGEITHAYVAGDVLAISMTHQSTGPTNANDRTYVTVVLENDLSDLGY